MKKISIEDLTDESLYHFTETNNIEKISEEGLIPAIGENSRGIEDTPKIFFSKGEAGILKVTEVWLRWLMNRIYGPNNKLNLYKDLTEEEIEIEISEWSKEFLSGQYKEDKKKKKQLFDYYYDYLKERTYLTLDIEEGKEYFIDDIDENKATLKKTNNKVGRAFAEVMYGDFSNMDDLKMDEWNMHTKTGKGIIPSKIKIVLTPDKKEDMLSLLLYVYNKHKNIPHNKLLLDDFIKYVEKRG